MVRANVVALVTGLHWRYIAVCRWAVRVDHLGCFAPASLCLFICLSVCLSVCLFVCLFVCLSDLKHITGLGIVK